MNIDFIHDAYTSDGLKLPMVHFEAKEKDICVICIHGMCGTIVDNYFATVWGKYLALHNVGFLYEHNRGHSIENDIVMQDGSFKRCGCMYEIFEESIYDIDLALEEAKKLGYKRFILLGHSFGCNKVIYYYAQKHPNILGVIFASAPDVFGSHRKYQLDYEEMLKEALDNINRGDETKLLHKMVEDYMYMSSEAYYNWFNDSANLNNLPVINDIGNWQQYASIDVPILTFSGSLEEEHYLHLDLLKEKATGCKDFTYEYIKDTWHNYKNKEEETAILIYKWLSYRWLK